MKVRLDFVTNSSSSSYICDISGGVESGWDLCLTDADMYECSNGHTFYSQYLVKDFEPVKFEELRDACCENIQKYENSTYSWSRDQGALWKGYLSEVEENKDDLEWLNEFACDRLEWNSRYDVNPKYCPICTLTDLSDSDCLAFFIKANKMNKGQVLAEIRKDFKDYDTFREFLNRKD